jgi:hypothetical protein
MRRECTAGCPMILIRDNEEAAVSYLQIASLRLKPPRFLGALRGAEAPLFHVADVYGTAEAVPFPSPRFPKSP